MFSYCSISVGAFFDLLLSSVTLFAALSAAFDALSAALAAPDLFDMLAEWIDRIIPMF